MDSFDTRSSKVLTPYQLSKQETFRIELRFSDQMYTETLPRKSVGLVNRKGEILPIHMNWNEAGDALILRAKDYINQESVVTLYVFAGIKDSTGQITQDSYTMDIELME